ncbi:DUF397 domain-containing protein [Streptomyces sp. NPDC052042]|uniref:DUF397 domain-containing protein n=1 Tax=Streptomyces sp. NPDC052042 TaxID=3365683 RepID=UPI0037D2E969
MASIGRDFSTVTWRKSSYSNGSGGECLEVAQDFAHWCKSSYSNGSGGNCLEVAQGNGDGGNCLEVSDSQPGLVPVRDSKRPDGPVLVLPASAWKPFIESVK